MIYFCCDKRRRNAVSKHPTLRGIDFVEVSASQQQLVIHFVAAAEGVEKAAVPQGLTSLNLKISGGERINNIRVVSVAYQDDVMVVTVDDDGDPVNGIGDFSTYTLHLIDAPDLDPLMSSIDFSFKVECPSEFDCKPSRVCPPEPPHEPEIDYLAKDYASFRRLTLDRLAVLMPQWKERNPADLGVALVELLAYVGDYLSYQQDAIATEAYFGTAHRRVSVRRHARLVDYFMHDGCNARIWVQVEVKAETVQMQKGSQLLTHISGQENWIQPDSPAYTQALNQRPVVFETMQDALLFQAHNQLCFYTWENTRCCLPKGATSATLRDNIKPAKRKRLRAGDVLIFEERLGPNTGLEADADLTRRHAVRLTRVDPAATQVIQEGKEVDRIPRPLVTDPLTNQALVEIEWAVEDALPFPFCISAVTDKEHGEKQVDDVSVARGNIVLADHGLTVTDNPLPDTVPPSTLFLPPVTGDDRCQERQRVPVPPRFRPQLKEKPLTCVAPYDPTASAGAAMRWQIRDALPAIKKLESKLNEDTADWHPKRDLLNAGPDFTEFVVEIETDGTTYLRFGDNHRGKRPDPGTKFTATYRVGNGVAGNIGAEALSHIVTTNQSIVKVQNPLPARGGVEPETIEEVRQRAPYAFRTQERAVTEEDYAEVLERHSKDSQVHRAAATFRWTGSWHTVFLTADRLRGLPVDKEFEEKTRQYVERFRMAGYDLEVDAPRFVSLEIEMHVCAKPDYFRTEVKKALLEVFSSRILPDGRRGVFHPDNFTFGQTVYLSHLYAAAQAVPGVASVRITTFQRQGIPDTKSREEGKLLLNRLEIARLDNDRNFPERGVFHLTVEGGK